MKSLTFICFQSEASQGPAKLSHSKATKLVSADSTLVTINCDVSIISSHTLAFGFSGLSTPLGTYFIVVELVGLFSTITGTIGLAVHWFSEPWKPCFSMISWHYLGDWGFFLYPAFFTLKMCVMMLGSSVLRARLSFPVALGQILALLFTYST